MPYLERDGRRLYVEEAGAGDPPLLLVHGWMGDHTHSAPQFGHFSRRHRVASPDLCGHGLSDRGGAHTIETHADDLAWLIGELALDRPVVIGHSLGGMVALQLAADRPEAVGALVLLDTILFLDRLSSDVDLGPLLERMRGPGRETVIRETVEGLFGPHDDPVRRAALTEEMMGTDLDVCADEVESMLAWDGQRLLRACSTPVLAITAKSGSRSDPSELVGQLPN